MSSKPKDEKDLDRVERITNEGAFKQKNQDGSVKYHFPENLGKGNPNN